MAWMARALVYSGRPDPQWPLDESQVHGFLELWASLPDIDDSLEAPSRLGYRGVLVTQPEGATWLATTGIVQHTIGAIRTTRSDADGRLERWVLETADEKTRRQMEDGK